MFRRKLAQALVKARYILTVCILAAAVICCVTISKTRINYDMNRYLSDDTMTKRALVVMEQEFGSAEQLRIMFTDRTEQQLEEYVAALNTAPEVMLAAHDPESGVILAEAAFISSLPGSPRIMFSAAVKTSTSL